MTKTQSRQFESDAERTARWIEDTGEFSPEIVAAANAVAAAITEARDEYGF
jgi:hypothetical protein